MIPRIYRPRDVPPLQYKDWEASSWWNGHMVESLLLSLQLVMGSNSEKLKPEGRYQICEWLAAY